MRSERDEVGPIRSVLILFLVTLLNQCSIISNNTIHTHTFSLLTCRHLFIQCGKQYMVKLERILKDDQTHGVKSCNNNQAIINKNDKVNNSCVLAAGNR